MTNETHADEVASSDQAFLESFIKQFTGLSKDIFIYGLSGSLGQLFSLITVPILTRLLTVDEFGTLDIIYATLGYFAILMGLNIGSGLWRYYYEVAEEDIKDRQEMVSSLLWFVLMIGIPVAVTIAVFGRSISISLFNKPDHAPAIQLAVLALPMMAVYNIFIGLQRLKRRPKNFLLINVGQSLLYFLLVMLFVIGFRKGIMSIFMAQLVAYSCGALVTLWLSRDLLTFTFSKIWFMKMAGYGLPLLPAAFLNWSLAAINRYFLNTYAGIVQVGYYSLASKIAQTLVIVVTAFTLAWEPFFLANLNKPESRRLYPMALNYYFAGMLAIGAIITGFAREIILIAAPPEYLPAAALTSILVLRQIIVGISYITGVGIVFSKKTIYYSISLGIGVLANLAANFLLTQKMGIIGAAFSELAGFLVSAILIFVISNRLYPIKWERKIVTMSLTGYILLSIVSILLFQIKLPTGWSLLLKLSIWLGYLSFLWFLIDSNQRKVLVRILMNLYTLLFTRLQFYRRKLS